MASGSFAAVPVEERGRSNVTPKPVERVYRREPAQTVVQNTAPSTSQAQTAAVAPASSSGLVELFTELQTMRGEVQELRGLVEQQAYRIKQLEQRQSEQYQDLDRRVASLSSRPAQPAASQGESNASGAAQSTVVRRTTDIPGNEKDAYAAAFDAMKAREFATSIEQFGVFVQTYPNGELTPNAFYWLGELHLAQSDVEDARQSFAQLINLYPDHQKVPDALYKMGVVYHRLGDNQRALDYLGRVRDQHPNSSAAGLAETYASELE